MSDYPDGSNYVEAKEHPNANLFKDVPIRGAFLPQGRGKPKIWRPTARGTIILPATASRLAEHADLVGYVLDPSRARIKRIDPVRGGKSFTSPGDWVEIGAPEPPENPVNELAAQAGEKLTPVELVELHQRLTAQIEAL